MLELRQITKRFGDVLANDHVDIVVKPGTIHAIVGENGAGKSTLMGILAGAVHADRGEMMLGGEKYAPDSPHDARRRGVTLIHQELSLCPHLTVTENV